MNRPRINTLVKLDYNPREPRVWDTFDDGTPMFFKPKLEKLLIKSDIANKLGDNRPGRGGFFRPTPSKRYYTFKKTKAYSTKEFNYSTYSFKRHKKVRGKKRHTSIYEDKLRYAVDYERKTNQIVSDKESNL